MPWFFPLSLAKARKRKLLFWLCMGLKKKTKSFSPGLYLNYFLPQLCPAKCPSAPTLTSAVRPTCQWWAFQPITCIDLSFFAQHFKIGLNVLVHSLCAQTVSGWTISTKSWQNYYWQILRRTNNTFSLCFLIHVTIFMHFW